MLEKFKTKFGFSLFEVLITMAIVAVFISACSNIFTRKHVRRVSVSTHGSFECYYDGSGALIQRKTSEDLTYDEVEDVTGDGYCSFVPPRNLAYLVISAVGGGGYGGEEYGGSAGEFESSFFSYTTHKLELHPGKAAESVSEDGHETRIYDVEDDGTANDDNLIVQVEGGRSDSSNNYILENCRIQSAVYSCGITASCTTSGTGDSGIVTVFYCSKNDPYGTNTSAEKTDTINNRAINTVITNDSGVTNAVTSAAGAGALLTYSTNYYVLVLDADGNFTPDEEDSPINNYIRALDITDGIGGLSPAPGVGGAAGRQGGTGAVFITW